MKTLITILTLGIPIAIGTAAFIAGMFYGRFKPVPEPQHLTLEQILSIKELHLVKHTYNDLFYLHKHNNPAKPIRAIVQIPVVVTAYLNLKDIQLVMHGDTITSILLPHAILNEPNYQVEKMVIRETRSFVLHAGKDQYPLVGSYIQARVAERIDTVRAMAVSHRIVLQAEEEGKAFIESVLVSLGRPDIQVSFQDAAQDSEVINLMKKKQAVYNNVHASMVEAIPFGFIPLSK
jgi:hypothetical protein